MDEMNGTDYIHDAVCGKLTLPAIPRVVAQIVLSLSDPAVSLHVITSALEQDPTLAARTLQLANSPYYGGRKSLATISAAVDMLGTDALQRMVLTVGLASVFVEVPTINLRQFWHGATATAHAARLVALSCAMPRSSADAAFFGALLHEIGHVILCQAFPEQARTYFDKPADLHGEALVIAEQQAFGVTHPEVGAAWAMQLGLPDEIGQAVRHYLAPWTSASGPLAPSLYLATLLVARRDAGMPAIEALALLDPALLDRAGVQSGRLEKLLLAWRAA